MLTIQAYSEQSINKFSFVYQLNEHFNLDPIRLYQFFKFDNVFNHSGLPR